MHMPEQNPGTRRHGIPPLTRRLGLRVRCARPGEGSGQGPETDSPQPQLCNGLMRGRSAARFRRILVVVKRQALRQPSSLERGSAATRTVVRSISRGASSDELTHISRINRR